VATWWSRSIGPMAWPWQYGDDNLPKTFTYVTLRCCWLCPLASLTAFDTFAEQMVTEEVAIPLQKSPRGPCTGSWPASS